MSAVDELFTDEIKETLQQKIGAYPLYVYCVNYLLNKGLWRKLENESLFNRNLRKSKNVNRRLTTYIKKFFKSPYIKRLFKRKPAVEEVDVLFLSRYRPIDINGKKGLKTDYLFNSIINTIHKNPLRLKMALVNPTFEREHYTDDRVHNLNVYDFLSLKILLKSIAYSSSLYFKYKKIITKLSNIEKQILSEFFGFRYLVPFHIRNFCLVEAIQNLNPKVIVSNDDTLKFKPSINGNFKLIVLQSASIVEELERYRDLLFSGFLEDKLLSDYFCVSGPQTKSLKEKFLKDTKKVVVTGQPRFDNLTRANEVFDKNKICRKLRLAIDKKILLWATQTHALPNEENRENISAVYHAANSLDNVRLVIKLHPAEQQEASLYKQNNSYVPLVVKGNKNISELLYICDVLITKSSTTTIEAAILNKPIIILNLSEKPNHVPYVEKGVALGVYNKEDLVSTIKDALYKEEVRKKLAKAREKFIYENAYLQDGRASERVANLIIQMVGESRKTKNENR